MYKILFPFTFDPRYPRGKVKFVLILQSGEYFKDYSTTTVLLITSNDEGEKLDHVVGIEEGTTDLWKTSFIECSQPYTLLKEVFYDDRVKCMGKLSSEKMNDVDEALYIGLNMGED
ncbi:type II toxin-antitoxin system PemK/MazF family toxin [Bacillus sp. N9]